jgi:radical SAM protein with 4Fe4S-binding SPASM domain
MLLSKPKPKLMILDICGICNAQCPFCPRLHMPEDRAKGYMSEEIFEKSVAEAKRLKIKKIRLYATAEPTLHPNFDQYVFRLKEEGFHVSVSTNAYTMHKHFESLSRVDFLKYSLEGWDKESYEKYRYPLKYDRVKRNIIDFWEYVKDKEQRPQINSLFLVTTKAEVNKFYECWADYMDHINVAMLTNTVQFKDGAFVSAKNSGIEDEYFDSNHDSSQFCTYPFRVINVTFDGKLALCCEDFAAKMDIGNIQDGLDKWQNGEVMKKVRRQFLPFTEKKICQHCSVFAKPTKSAVDSIQEKVDQLPIKFKVKTDSVILLPK